MKKTSRRNFGKQLTGALAASALTPLVTKGQAEDEKPKSPTAQLRLRTHDTPPPLEFDNGSFVVEKKENFSSDGRNNDRWEYRIDPPSGYSVLQPAHIKIVEGNGDLLYRNDAAENTSISIELRDNANRSTMVNAKSAVSGSPPRTKFIVDVADDKRLNKGNEGNKDKPSSKERNRRYRHSDGDELRMYEITIRAADNQILYRVRPENVAAHGADLKVMIWFQESIPILRS